MYNNTRRGGNNQNMGRRSVGKPNFVPGPQLTPQRGGGIQYPQKPATGGTPAPVKTQAPQTPTKPVVSNIATRQQAPSTPVSAAPVVVPQSPVEQKPLVQPIEPMPIQNEDPQNGEKPQDGEKKSWMNRKIPKKERIRRRNMRLSKLLQPKNALMILHELVKNPTFNVVEAQGQYKAILVVAGVEHVGFGKSKASAKNVASENAIKHLLKSKKVEPMEAPSNANEEGDDKMDTFDANESPADAPLPWQQVASFALYKLFDSWGENPTIAKVEEQPKRVQAAKKMPEHPEAMNPIMFVNQMYPEAAFDELQPIGTAPNITFKIICKIDGQSFEGTGSTKKAAKKQASYAACHSLLGVNYPPEVYTPQ